MVYKVKNTILVFSLKPTLRIDEKILNVLIENCEYALLIESFCGHAWLRAYTRMVGKVGEFI